MPSQYMIQKMGLGLKIVKNLSPSGLTPPTSVHETTARVSLEGAWSKVEINLFVLHPLFELLDGLPTSFHYLILNLLQILGTFLQHFCSKCN